MCTRKFALGIYAPDIFRNCVLDCCRPAGFSCRAQATRPAPSADGPSTRDQPRRALYAAHCVHSACDPVYRRYHGAG